MTQQEIMEYLCKNQYWVSIKELCIRLDLTQSTVNECKRKLVRYNIVDFKQEGKKHYIKWKPKLKP